MPTELDLAPAYPAALPSDDSSRVRLQSLSSLQLLDSAPEEGFDDLVKLASSICQTPIALVCLLDEDRQWFKARVGLGFSETPISQSFCAYAVGAPHELFIVEDATEDIRFRENPLVLNDPSIRAYAGMPVLDGAGTPLGTICVIDTERRSFTLAQQDALRVISKQISTQIELRRRVHQLQYFSRALQASNEQIGQFANIIAHDLLAPIRQQSSLSVVLKEDYGDSLSQGARGILDQIGRAGQHATDLITDIGTYVQSGQHDRAREENLKVGDVIHDVLRDVDFPATIIVEVCGDLNSILEVNRAALYHILLNLLSNAIKFSRAERGEVRVKVVSQLDDVRIEVIDNGPGIPQAQWLEVFELFRRGPNAHDKPGRGLGLSIARRLALSLCGDLTVYRDEALAETVFSLVLPKVSGYGLGG